jgi:hypothetical protein
VDARIRAGRAALLWLLRTLYVARMALCYVVMTRGRHAAPDLVWGSFTVCLFVNSGLFLAAFFDYEAAGRRAIVADAIVRPVALAALIGAALSWAGNPGATLGWARGAGGPALLAAEFLLLPLLTFGLSRTLGRASARAPASASGPGRSGPGTVARPT